MSRAAGGACGGVSRGGACGRLCGSGACSGLSGSGAGGGLSDCGVVAGSVTVVLVACFVAAVLAAGSVVAVLVVGSVTAVLVAGSVTAVLVAGSLAVQMAVQVGSSLPYRLTSTWTEGVTLVPPCPLLTSPSLSGPSPPWMVALLSCHYPVSVSLSPWWQVFSASPAGMWATFKFCRWRNVLALAPRHTGNPDGWRIPMACSCWHHCAW
ncbi:hypothetical protein NDU88_005047 [Pleurodeles waltl]|uniref:Uncharacterized protein n=1 Tax=Pleurodeles waltl TaxID=8319 RepID=A0AAV7QDL5_PLEWA|nr:hypothetical protein NDU88_005047 [Pleurodeles waltl]